MKTAYWICLFLFTTSLLAQEEYSISGNIKDMSNGETLPGATVSLKETGRGVSANIYGFYSLTAPEGNYTMVISFIGYKTIEKQITLNQNLRLDFEVEEDAVSLNEVVISTEGNKRVDLKSTQMGMNKIQAKKIKEIPAVMGEVDVIKSIQLLPGVTNSGEGSSGFNVRGGAEDQNLILFDEAIIYNSSHLFGFFSVFNADALKEVKLYKGGIPAEFGGRASSVLDIRLREGNSKEYHLTGGIGSISSRLTAEGPAYKGKGSFLVAGRASYANIFLKMINNDSRVGFYDLNFKTNYQINNNNRIFLSAYVGRDNFNLADAFENAYGNVSANLRWNHVFSDKLFSNLSLIYSQYDYGLVIDGFGIDWNSDILNYNLKYDMKYYQNDKLTYSFGLSAINYDFNPGNVTPTDNNSSVNSRKLEDKFATEAALYMSLDHKITPSLTVTYGLRYSTFFRLGEQTLNLYDNDLPVIYNNELGIYERAEAIGEQTFNKGKEINSFGQLEPRLALSYVLNEFSSVKISYNKMSQYLHLISNTTSATPLDVWAPSGEYIDPQIANQYSAGYFRNFKDGKYSLETEVYYKTVDNRVDYIDGADLIAQNNIEREILQGESRAYGLELMAKKNTGTISGWVSYTISKAEQRTLGGKAGGPGINDGEWYNTVYDRTHDISITGVYKLNKKWSFAGNFVFQTGRPVTYPNGQFLYNGLSVQTYSVRNADRLPAYHRLDLSATLTPENKKERKWKGEWVFSIYNAYNRRNAASISFGQNVDTGLNEATRTAIYSIVPSITYNFKF